MSAAEGMPFMPMESEIVSTVTINFGAGEQQKQNEMQQKCLPVLASITVISISGST